MDLSGDLLRGHTNAIILSILEIEDNYGYKINIEMSNKSNNYFMLTEATMYTCLKRLEKDGYILSYWLEGNNNIKRKYYTITKKGKTYLDTHKKDWEKVKEIINKFMEDKNGKQD